ncbi:MAG: acyltransferase [Flavobacteriales bacterium]|jgi:acetyltransferase-like isoleucine patch superfamily enzyme|nr:acyltransferase [Flavobacteriales bacterium]
MKIVRKISEFKASILNIYRITKLKLKYSNLKIDYRSTIGKNCSIHCDNNSKITLTKVVIGHGVVLHAKHSATINLNDCYIGHNSVIVSINSITIEPHVEVAEMVVIRDQDHQHNNTSTPIAQQGYNSAPILIKRNSWIAAKATILRGVTINENAVVGAHSLVNKSVPKNMRYAGIPAKPINKKV